MTGGRDLTGSTTPDAFVGPTVDANYRGFVGTDATVGILRGVVGT
jgi:hypothetical protein